MVAQERFGVADIWKSRNACSLFNWGKAHGVAKQHPYILEASLVFYIQKKGGLIILKGAENKSVPFFQYVDLGVVSVYYSSKKSLPAKTRVFVDFLLEHFQESLSQRFRAV